MPRVQRMCKGFAFSSFIIYGVILVFNDTCGKTIPSFAGPYKVIVNTLTNDSDDFHSNGKFYWKGFTAHPKSAGEPQYIRAQFVFNTPIDDSMRSEVKIAVWNHNQWKKNAFVMHFNRSCTSFFGQAMTLVKFIWLPAERRCPLPAFGTREFPNQTYEFKFPTFPVMPYGRYRLSLAVLNKAKHVLGMLVVDGNLVPRVR